MDTFGGGVVAGRGNWDAFFRFGMRGMPDLTAVDVARVVGGAGCI